MSGPRRSKRPKSETSAPSGEHPAVVAFQKTIEGMQRDAGEPLESLNRDLAEYLAAVKTPVPPPLAEDEVTPTKP